MLPRAGLQSTLAVPRIMTLFSVCLRLCMWAARRGLLKVVFATGTLAAGINMPARTTVISALSRRTDDGHQLLPHNELLQVRGSVEGVLGPRDCRNICEAMANGPAFQGCGL